jgi:hypothetical protein
MKQISAVYIKAYDWAVHEEQVTHGYQLDPVVGHIVGFPVEEDEHKIVLAWQAFDPDGLRYLIAVPKACIIERIALGARE